MSAEASHYPEGRDLERVKEAFASSSLRTPGGVARSTGLPETQVLKIMKAHPESFGLFPIRLAGGDVYQLRRANGS